MESFLLWISLFSLIYSKWISNNIVHSYNDTKITIKEIRANKIIFRSIIKKTKIFFDKS